MSLLEKRVAEIHQDLRNKEYTVAELVRESRKRIDAVDNKVKAFLRLNEAAEEEAKKLDEQLARQGADNMLYGIPMGIKDNIVTKGVITTCASKILANYDPIYDATVMERLNSAQAVMMGKLNMDEFAMGSSSENSAFRPVRNPWNEECVPGGSSGGSAAAVAAGEVYFALGSDTGGSIRQPAAYCGIVGLKPTYGRVSRFGLVAFASSLDQIGPLTKNVEDAAAVLQAIAGHDPLDSTSAQVDVPDYLGALTGEVRGLKIGVPKQYMGEGVDPQVKEAVSAALRQFESLGAVWEEVSLPHSEYALAAYYIISSCEASSNLARYDGVRYGLRSGNADNLLDMYTKSRSEGFGDEVKRRIMLGTYALSSGYYDAYYLKAQKVRTLIRRDFEEAFARYDILVGPTTPTPAFCIGSQVHDPLTMYMNDICTIPVSLAGLPAISVPCGTADGLPVGLQIIGKPFDEATVLRAAHAFEQSTDHHLRRPALQKGE